MPANRSQIHVNKLGEFSSFLRRLGYEVVPPRANFEVLRVIDSNGDTLSFYKRDRTDHVTIQYGKQTHLAKRFIAEQKRKAATR